MKVRLRTFTLLICLALVLVVSGRSVDARAHLIAVFPIRSTPELTSTAIRLQGKLVERLAALEGYDAIAVKASPSGSAGIAAAQIGAESYVTGQLLAADNGYKLVLGSFEAATDAPIGHYSANLGIANQLPDEPNIASLINRGAPLPRTAFQAAAALADPCYGHRSATQGLTVKVVAAWHTGVEGGLVVHDRVEIQGGDVDETVTPCDFRLNVTLLNGDHKAISASTQSSTYDLHVQGGYVPLIGGLLTPKLRPAVDPHEDLGGLGSVKVPAGVKVTTVVSFVIFDYLDDPGVEKTDVTFAS